MEVIRRLQSGGEVRRLAATRNGMLVIAALVALLAGAFLLLFLSRYRDSVNDTSPVTVLVAKGLIEKGTPGDIVITKGMFETSRITKREEKQGAIGDPASLRAQVASADIYPGEQLTSKEFTGSSDSLANKISGYERAISIPLDAAHGMIGEVKTGDHVDVLAGFNVDQGVGGGRPMLRAVMQNALVMRAPSSASASGAGPTKTENVVLKAPDKEAWKFAFSSEYGKVWIVLRAKAGAAQSTPSVVTLESILFGTKPITAKGR
jgi:Flp pilus assembly protein CpaB